MSDAADESILIRALGYIPNTPAAIISGSVITIVSFLLFFVLIRRRNWWGLCLPIGALTYGVSFFLRILAKNSPTTGNFIAMQLLSICSPATFLAFNYIIYGRFVQKHVGDGYSLVRANLVARVFVISDVTTFVIQGGGGGLLASKSSSTANLGRIVILVGLVAQLLSYIFFMILILSMHLKLRKERHPIVQDPAWFMVTVLYFSSVFITLRGVYRTIEFAEGNDGTLRTHEIYFYILDAMALLLAIIGYVPFWPGRYIDAPGPSVLKSGQDSRDTVQMDTRRGGPGYNV